MDSLLRCERCDHGAALHGSSGCDARRCVCRLTRERLVDDGIAAARAELAQQWLVQTRTQPAGKSFE